MKEESRLLSPFVFSGLLHVLFLYLFLAWGPRGDYPAEQAPGRQQFITARLAHPAPLPDEDKPALSSVTTPAVEAVSRESASRSREAAQKTFPVQPIHYFLASELNRRPVLLHALPEPFGENNLIDWGVRGEAIFRIFIDTEGRIVELRREQSNLPAHIIALAEAALRSAHFMPGYLNGDPVPAQIRWQFTVASEGQSEVRVITIPSGN